MAKQRTGNSQEARAPDRIAPPPTWEEKVEMRQKDLALLLKDMPRNSRARELVTEASDLMEEACLMLGREVYVP